MIDVHELAEIYGLPEETVKAELLESLSRSLTGIFGAEVEVLSSGSGALEIYRYQDSAGDLRVRSMPLFGVGRRALRQVRRDLTLALAKMRVLRDYDLFRDLAGNVIEGMVTKAVEHGSLSVRLFADSPYSSGKVIIGSCPYRRQTPKERSTYRPGDILSFQVLEVSPIMESGMPRLEVIVGRNGRGLVEGLLRKQLRKSLSGKDLKIKCVKRIAGAYSEVVSSSSLPAQDVKRVSDELKEYIRVARI